MNKMPCCGHKTGCVVYDAPDRRWYIFGWDDIDEVITNCPHCGSELLEDGDVISP